MIEPQLGLYSMFGHETSFPGPQYGLSLKPIPFRQSSLKTKNQISGGSKNLSLFDAL